MFGWELPPSNSGGLGTASAGIATALSLLDFDLTFVLPTRVPISDFPFKVIFADELEGSIKDDGKLISAYARPGEEHLRDEAYTRPGEEHFRDDLTGRVFRYAENASRVALTFPHDVIHAHDWLSFGAGISAKRASRAPLVVHVHATEFDRTGGHSEHPTIAAVEADGLSNADSIIAVSQYTKNIVCERYNIDDEKVSVVHNGYDSSEIAFTTNQSFDWLKKIGFKIVLFVGRITLQKGPEYFIRAAVRTLEHYPKVIFLVAGSGDMEPAMIREAARAGISERVLFSGFVRGEELASLYKSADLYVMPSVSEPFGITALEAAAAGVPVIISKQSGVSEVLKHAIAVDFWDTEELAAKIIAVLTHAPLANVIRRNTFVEAISSTWRKAASSISRLYRKLISRKS